MRLGFPTEDNNKKPVTQPHKSLRLGFPTTPSPSETVSTPPKTKPPKIVIPSRLGFPTTPYRPIVPKISISMPSLSPPTNCITSTESNLPEDLVSIIILSYNTFNVTFNCIKSVLEKTVHPFELFVVDNGSQDGTVDWLRDEKYLALIANQQNLGYSKANNLAIRQARGEYMCLLNSDIIVRTRGWLKHMVDAAKSSTSIGTVGAKLLYPNGTIQHIGGGIHLRAPYHPYDKYPADTEATNASRNVPYNTGACLLITRTALNKVGLLDEDYPFGFEDVDYGLRVVEQGLQNVVCPKAVLTHLWAYTQRKTGKGITMSSLARFHVKWNNKLPELAKKVTLDWGAPWHV